MARRPPPDQLSLNFFEVPPAPVADAGGQDVAALVRETLSRTLHETAARGLDRFEVAALVSRRSGRDMTKNMLDRYCAEAGEWRFPLEALPALTLATGDYRLLERIAEVCGCRLLRGEEAMLAEIGALTLQERATKERLSHIRRHIKEDVMERLVAEVRQRLGATT